MQGSGVQCRPPARMGKAQQLAGPWQRDSCRSVGPGQAQRPCGCPLCWMWCPVWRVWDKPYPSAAPPWAGCVRAHCSRSQGLSGEQGQSPGEDSRGVRPATCCFVLCVRLKRPRLGLRETGEWAFPDRAGTASQGALCVQVTVCHLGAGRGSVWLEDGMAMRGRRFEKGGPSGRGCEGAVGSKQVASGHRGLQRPSILSAL